MGEVRHGKHWQGLLTAGWFLTRNHSGGNTKRIGMPGKRRDCRGMARKAMEWHGLLTAVSIYWVLIGGNTKSQVVHGHGVARRRQHGHAKGGGATRGLFTAG